MYGFDAETEALRQELAQLPHKELLALAQQEGVRVAGLAGAEIIEALLRMGNDDAAAVTAHRHAPGQLAHHKDQPPSRLHAGCQSGSAPKQQQYSPAEYTHNDVAGPAHNSKQHQQLGYQQQQQQGMYSGGMQHAAAQTQQQLHQHQQRQQQQQSIMAQAQQPRTQRSRQRRSNDSDQEIPHESSFQKADAGLPAGRPCTTPAHRDVAAAHLMHGDDSRGVPFGDQVAFAGSSRPQQGTPDARTRARSASVPRSGSSGGGRAGTKPGQTTPRDVLKQQQHLDLATKMQELELTLQKMPQRSPRPTFVHPDAVSAQASYSATKSSGGGGSAAGSSSGGSGPSSATKTNRRLWDSPPVAPHPRQGPAAIGFVSKLSPESSSQGKPSPATRAVSSSSSNSSSRPAGHSSGRSLESAFSGASRPRSAGLAAAAAAGAVSSPGRPMSSGGGARSSNILAEHASLQRSGAGAAPCQSHLSPRPQQQQQQQASTPKQEHTRALTLSPAPAKGTPRVGVMPCQKALLKKAAQEAAKAEAAAAEAVAAAAASKSALRAAGLPDRPSSSKGSSGGGRGTASSHGGATPSKLTGGGSSSGAVGRGAVSSSGAVQRSGGGMRAGTPEPPARRNAAASASSAAAAGMHPLPSTMWPQQGVGPGPMPSPKLPAGRSAASASGALLGTASSLEERQFRSSRARTAAAAAAAAQASGSAAGSGAEAGLQVVAGRSVSVSGQGRGAPRAGAVTPPPNRGLATRAASARGSGLSSTQGNRPGSSAGQQQQQQQGQRDLLSMSGTGLAGRARQLLAGSPVLGRHARKEAERDCADPMRAQQTPAAAKQLQMLHTPVRVKAAPAVSTANRTAGRAAGIQDPKPVAAGYSSPVAAKTRSIAAAAAAAVSAAAAAAVSAAATPARQVRAFGEGVSAAYNEATSPNTARKKAPLAGTAAAAAAAAATDGPAVLIGGMMTPKAAAMGSARRVTSTRPRTGLAAAGASDTAAVGDKGGSSDGGAAGLVTPLHKGARRMVPSDGGGDEVDKHLQALVERCLRIRHPDAHKLALQGPEPAKRWLQQHLVGPWKRAGRATSSSSGGGGACAAAGYCCRSLLLRGPNGSGKTELVHALAAEMGSNLLYVPGGDNLLKTYQQEGHRLLRAMFEVARRVAPCVLCFDDAHITFPSSASRMSDPGGAAAVARMVVELEVQLHQLSDMQASLEAAAAQPPHSAVKAAAAGSSAGGGSAPRRGPPDSSSEGSGLRPVWGFFSSKVKGKKQQLLGSDGGAEARQAQQQQQSYRKMGGPVVVVFVTQAPEALDGAVLQQLGVQLALEQPTAEAREDLLMGWLMERDAALNVQDLEWLARQTEGFSCSELVQLCQLAARRAAQERPLRAISMDDLDAALHAMLPLPTKQQQQQQRSLQLRHHSHPQQQQQTPHRSPGTNQQQRQW